MIGNFPLSGKIIAVTGGASGIGLAFSKLAVSSGARVIIADLKLSRESEQLAQSNSNVSFYKCNVANWKDLEGLIPHSESTFGDVPDVYAANAGIGESMASSFWNDREQDRYATLDVNLAHPIKLSRIALRALWNRDKKGVVVITSSVAGMYGHFSTPLYSASKHGTIGLIKSLAAAESEVNVKVVGVCPGLVYTPLLMGIAKAGGAELGDSPTFIRPEEIAARMKDLVEQDKYRGGTALGVYRPGDAAVVADGSYSELELLAPSNLENIRSVLEKDKIVS